MAIAPLGDPKELREEGAAAPLRLIRGGRPAQAPPRRTAVHARPESTTDASRELRRARAAHPTAGAPEWAGARDAGLVAPRTVHEAQRVSAVRAQTLSRRRRTVAVLVTIVALGLLAAPVRALGAMTVSGQSAPNAVPSGLADGSTYVVQPGDTIRSIAMRINPANAGALERELVASVGSSTLVAGEHVVIP